MSAEIDSILAQIPKDEEISQAVWEFLDKEIRTGGELNGLQRDSVWAVVRTHLTKNIAPTPPTVPFFAFCYNELVAEAKTNEDAKKRLAELVKAVKAHPPIASGVAQLAQQISQEREKRRQELAKAVAAMLARDAQAGNRATDNSKRDPAKAYIAKIQSARHGTGENAVPSLELAVQLADEAVEAYPTNPSVLFEAAGCHQLLAEKSKQMAITVRYVHLKQAFTLYQQCLERLTAQPYANLKEGYDAWRKGLAELLPKIQEKLAVLQEKQG